MTTSSIPTLRWGIIGAGGIARKFARAMPKAAHGTLAAVASRDQAKAAAFAAEHAVGARAHGSYEALLADPAVDAVYIATPHPLHARWAMAACAAGKHVLCEKPLALNAWEVEAMQQAAREHGVFLMEAYMYRCHPQTTRALELVRAGTIGEVRTIRASFGFRCGDNPEGRLLAVGLGGGGILDVGGYPVSFARLVAGAALGCEVAEPLSVAGAGHLGATGVDEHASAVLGFAGGIIAEVATGVRLNRENDATIVGTQGSIHLDHPWTHHPKPTARIEIRRQGEEPRSEPIGDAVDAYACEIDLVATCVGQGRQEAAAPAMSWSDSLGQARTLDRWREAIGLLYPSEKPAGSAPVRGGALRAQPATANRPAMPCGRIPGLDKPVSRLVMGCDNQRDFRHGAAVWDDWFERGGNAFDTAHIYAGGEIEKNLGAWMESRGVREQAVVLVKGAHTPECLPERIGQQLAISLERLRTGYADVYLMHRDNPAVPVGEFVDALDAEARAGRIHAFGGSNWSMERLAAANAYAAAHGRRAFTALSNQLSLARMVAPVWGGCISAGDPASRAALAAAGIALLPWSSQARGFFLRGDPAFTGDAELTRCWYCPENFARLARTQELAAARGVQPIHIALAWVLHQPFPTFPLVGPRTIAEIASCCSGLAVELSATDAAYLEHGTAAQAQAG
jgi:predicted dehydrogenase/aryl-alcohol dehydrogenase-like predicted oxidoreductase